MIMENNEDIVDDKEKGVKESLLNHPSNCLGGIRTLPFILANEGFERAAYTGIGPNMILYLMGEYGLSLVTGSSIIFLWSAATNLTPILSALLADAYVGRFRMIGFGSVSTFLGMVLLWSTTTIRGVRPSFKDTTSNSSTPTTTFQLMYLCISLGLMSIGAGGIRSSTLAFGADQLQNIGDVEHGKPGSSGALASLFNWFYFSVTVAMLIAFTCIVYIQDHMGWQVGFAVPVLLMFVSTVSFFSASSFYVKKKPAISVLGRPVQVLAAAWRNRGYKFSGDAECIYHVAQGSVFQVPTKNLRFLNKACMVRDRTQDLALNQENVPNPWNICTIDQVEEFKLIIKVIPLWLSTIILGVNATTLGSFLVLQAKAMDKHIFKTSFEIPPASFGTFALVSLMIWLVLYDRVIIPLASKFAGKAVAMDAITRTGIGLLLSFVYMVVAGFVENARRGISTSNEITQMSALWLVPQVCLLGLADGIAAIAQLEFFYSEFPSSMTSISSNLFGVSTSIGSLVASFILRSVDSVTKQGGNESWVVSDPNKGHYDYYYWLIASFSLVNFVYFLLCSRAFKEAKKVSQDKMNY